VNYNFFYNFYFESGIGVSGDGREEVVDDRNSNVESGGRVSRGRGRGSLRGRGRGGSTSRGILLNEFNYSEVIIKFVYFTTFYLL